jgi:hypothetical protein
VKSFRNILVLFGIFAVVVAVQPQTVRAASGGIQYNELVKFVMGSQTPPEPGSFGPDWQAAMNAANSANSAPQHHGMFGNIMNALNQAKSAMSIFQTGMASTEYYLNGWERTDDITNQTATIKKPQLHQVIYLNLKNKTYRIEDTTVHPITETPPPYTPPAQPGSPPPSPQPGTAKVTISVSTTSLGSKVLDGEPSQGYKFDFKITSTQATGSCTNGTFETAMTIWDSRYPQPTLASSGVTPMKPRTSALPNPEMASFKPGCKPKITARTHLGPTPPSGRLALWQLLALSASAQTTQGSGGGGFQTLIELGNIKQLGSSDASLFDIPAGFTKESASPSP